MIKYPTLYKKTSTGALQEWTVFVIGNQYQTQFGQTGGKLQNSEPIICSGKNVGKANETTAEQQANLEAKALWTKKLKKDYTETREEALAGGSSALIKGGVLPMLAHKFSEQGDKLSYPCYVQPKLDGHRCIAMPDGTLWSRTRKRITGLPHIEIAVRELKPKYPLDGELYNHDYRNKFEKLSHFIRQSKPKSGHECVQYHVYDTVSPLNFSARSTELWSKYQWALPLVQVTTVIVRNEDELMLAFESFLEQGYEGAIARNAKGRYENKRSYNLLKIKKFDDAEFKCIGVAEGQGKMAGHARFICSIYPDTQCIGLLSASEVDAFVEANPGTFVAKKKGKHNELAKYINDPSLVVAKQVTVKYQGFTNKRKVPRFPVALRIKEDL